jgi:endonuclease/exonuclease/phosphatase family metal-dependent hydrolase
MFAPATFDQRFRPFLNELARFESTKDLQESRLYQKLRPELEGILDHVWTEELVPGASLVPASRPIKVVAWNIERGLQINAITRLLTEHSDLAEADVLLLSELDWGMARTGNRFVAREIAAASRMNYAFAPCYVALTKGAGVEKSVSGENLESLHGNALLSRYPMKQVHSLALPNGKDKMKGAEKRIGSQRAVIADIEHPQGRFRAVSLHLDAHSSQRHRYQQMKEVLNHLQTLEPQLPVIIGGDWNTTTHNASRALYSILGYLLRVLMGVRNVVSNHYPYPERWFERRLFGELARRGYRYRDLNKMGDCTLHYNVRDIVANLNMGEWIPHWCFWFINWALNRTGGSCSMKLDWFAGKGVRCADAPGVVHGLTESGKSVSDHDPIFVSLSLG